MIFVAINPTSQAEYSFLIHLHVDIAPELVPIYPAACNTFLIKLCLPISKISDIRGEEVFVGCILHLPRLEPSEQFHCNLSSCLNKGRTTCILERENRDHRVILSGIQKISSYSQNWIIPFFMVLHTPENS